MKRWARLNDRQHTVLQRIGQATMPVTSQEPELALTVYALRSRGLVTTSRQPGGWIAQFTDAGRYYLTHGHHPEHPSRQRRPRPPAASSDEEPTPQRRRSYPAVLSTPRGDPDAAGRARALIVQLQSQRTIRIADPDRETRARWRRAIHAAKTGGLVPPGKHLWHSGRDYGDLIIRLRSGGHPSHAYRDQPRLKVPDTIERSNPVVAVLSADPNALRVCPDCRPRALRIIQALVDGAIRLDHEVVPGSDAAISFVVLINGHRYPITLSEATDRAAREGDQQDAWRRGIDPDPEPVFAHRLELGMPAGWPHAGRRVRWGDRRRWRLEAKLAQVLAEIEERARLDEAARRAQERERLRRREQWKQAMCRARDRVIEARRLAALRDQLGAWHHARAIRIYATALDQQLRVIKDPAAAHHARAWLRWIRAHADRIDPSRQPPGMPPSGRISPDDLRPFLDGWSPFGPDHHR